MGLYPAVVLRSFLSVRTGKQIENQCRYVEQGNSNFCALNLPPPEMLQKRSNLIHVKERG